MTLFKKLIICVSVLTFYARAIQGAFPDSFPEDGMYSWLFGWNFFSVLIIIYLFILPWVENFGNSNGLDTQAISTQATVTCSPFSGTGSTTSVMCAFTVCGTNVIVASNAPGSGGSCTGDTYLYLYVSTTSTLVAENDDSGSSLCSALTYTQTVATCVSYRLQQSCFSSSACSGNTVVTYNPIVSVLLVFHSSTEVI